MCFAAPISNRETVVDRPKPLDASIAALIGTMKSMSAARGCEYRIGLGRPLKDETSDVTSAAPPSRPGSSRLVFGIHVVQPHRRLPYCWR
jgi:hypothetical protein